MIEEKSKLLPSPPSELKELNFGTILLAIYILLDFGAIQGVFDYIVVPLRIPFLVALISLLYAMYLVLKKQVPYTGTGKIFIFLCLYIIIDAQIRSTENSSRAILTLFLQYLSNYIIMVSCVRKPAQFIFLLDILILSVSHSCYHAIMQGGKLWDSIWLKDENHISIIASFTIPLSYILWMNYKSKIKKAFYVISLFFFVTAVAVAASRGGALAMIASAFFCWLLYQKKIRNLLVVLLAVILIFIFAPPRFFSEMDTLKEGTSEGTANDRIYLWGIAFDMFLDNPVFGVGPMNYPAYMLSYDIKKEFRFERRVFDKGEGTMVAHSTPVTWIAEFGIFGTVVFICLQYRLYQNWRFGVRKTIYSSDIPSQQNDRTVIRDISHAIAISHISFWVAASFLTLLPYPFYWILVPLSETWKNLSDDIIVSK